MRDALPFVGRAEQLADLRDVGADGGTVIVTGEPGTGKSRLIHQLCCDDSITWVPAGGAEELRTAPYGLVRILALQWQRLLDPQSLGWTNPQLATLAPVFPQFQPAEAVGDPAECSRAEQQQGLWLSLLRYLDALVVAHHEPVALIVEDLHVVDAASLRLLNWLATQPLDIAIIGTCRTHVPEPVAGLPTIELGALDITDIEELLNDLGIESIGAQSLRDLTAGLPLRVSDWVRSATSGAPSHEGDLLRRALDGCDRPTIDALRVAALLPEKIEPAVLTAVLPLSEDDALLALSDAQARGVITQNQGGTWHFAVDGFRTAVLGGLDHNRRRTYERRLVDGLRDQLGARPDLVPHLAAVATRLGDDLAEAAALHLAAGTEVERRDPTAAETHFRQAVALAESAHDERLILDATLALGLAQVAAADSEATTTLQRAYPLAEALRDGDSFARAALAEPVGLGHIGVSMMTNHVAVARLRRALAQVSDPSLEARLLVALAVQQHSSLSEEAYRSLLDQAEELAADLDDPTVENLILAARVGARRASGAGGEPRAEVQRRLDRLDPFDPDALPMLDLAITLACRAGDLSGAENLLRRYEDEFAPLPPVARWSVLCTRSAIAFARGSIETARALSLEALNATAASRLEPVALEHFGFQITALLRERRKIAEARPTIETWVTEHPSSAVFRASRAWLHADSGEPTVARADLEVFFAQDLIELRGRTEGPIAIATAVGAAFAIGGEGVRAWCERGHELLAPLADEWLLVGRGSLIEGPVVRVMALASAALGLTDRALEENSNAQRMAQESGALLFSWHSLRDRGLILQRADRHAEADEALAEAADRYRAAGLDRQAGWVDERVGARATDRAASPASASIPHGEFRRDHRIWRVGLGDESALCRHLKGMPMIAALIGAPGQSISAAMLAAIGDGGPMQPVQVAISSASTQALVDDDAVSAYRRRLDEIVSELDRADRRGDAEMSARLTAEFDSVTAELASTHGLGGRRRAMTSEDERARVRVNKAVRSAIRRISEQAPGLAAHLERSIDTGLFCSYRPDPLHPVDWTLQ